MKATLASKASSSHSFGGSISQSSISRLSNVVLTERRIRDKSALVSPMTACRVKYVSRGWADDPYIKQ